MNATQLQIFFSLLCTTCLGVFVLTTWVGAEEGDDAQRVKTVELALEKLMLEGNVNLKQQSDEHMVRNVIYAVKASLPQQTHMEPSGLVDAPYVLILPDAKRKAFFTISQGGDVEIQGLTGHWTQYHLLNGEIVKH